MGSKATSQTVPSSDCHSARWRERLLVTRSAPDFRDFEGDDLGPTESWAHMKQSSTWSIHHAIPKFSDFPCQLNQTKEFTQTCAHKRVAIPIFPIVLLSIESEKFCSSNYPVLSELTLLQLQLCDSALQQLPWRQETLCCHQTWLGNPRKTGGVNRKLSINDGFSWISHCHAWVPHGIF